MKIIIGSRKKVVKSGLVLISGSWGSKIMAFGEEHGAVMGQTDSGAVKAAFVERATRRFEFPRAQHLDNWGDDMPLVCSRDICLMIYITCNMNFLTSLVYSCDMHQGLTEVL